CCADWSPPPPRSWSPRWSCSSRRSRTPGPRSARRSSGSRWCARSPRCSTSWGAARTATASGGRAG
ncbi:MAG: hypothetical protein AVDCRST_MAG30-1356, partial [uncultured Solirubrobacteraceae bacterium]